MSGVIDNLENLDNKALREKCLEYGLPNIPITDTSRKLLIKRLRTAMEGGQKTTEKAKSRRETIHVIKVETETSKVEAAKETPSKAKASSRRTIGNPSLPVEDEPPARATVTQRRRSGRTTPISQLEPVVPASVKRKADDVIKEDEEDSIPIPVIVERTTTEPVRQTRAPSLSKSVVVTTSYIKDVPKEIVELDDTEPEELEEEEEELAEDLDLEPQFEPVKYKYLSSSRNYDTTKPFSSLEKGSTINYSIGSPQLTSRISLSKAPTETLSYESAATRRYTVGGYKSSTDANESRTFAHQPEYIESKDDDADTPYLSDFARRLSRLKADPITPVISTPVRAERDARYYGPVSARRGIGQNGSISDSFNNLLIALDRKYHLKRNFIIFAVILAVILIFVLFF